MNRANPPAQRNHYDALDVDNVDGRAGADHHGMQSHRPVRTTDRYLDGVTREVLVCVGISLQQDGDDIAGTACARSDGVLLYSGVPVRGDHPRISFEVASTNTQPCCAHLAGTRFSGRQDSTEDIVGRLGRVDIRFERSNTSVCNQAGD
jgi:hypothetical protein